ncbi:hypothetical protein J6E39_09160 [bacterium]|nr:hypothetical protein [bacterium]
MAGKKNKVEEHSTVKNTDEVEALSAQRPVRSESRKPLTDIRQRVLQRIPDPKLIELKDSPLQFYTNIRDKFYSKIRAGKELIYKPRPNYNPKEFDTALNEVSNGFYGKVEGAWKYRYPQNMDITKPITDRLSLNVYQDKELIHKLDAYLSENCPNAHYKCAGAGNIGWNQRHDTVTIYFSNNLTPKVQQDIAKLAQPHTRANNSAVMLGDKISDGVYHIAEPTIETIKPLLIKAKQLNLEPEFYEWLGCPDFHSGAGIFIIKNGERVVHTSPGSVESLRQMLNMFEKI